MNPPDEPVIDPHFPERPTPEEVAAEYTPERVMRLARFIAGKRGNRKWSPKEYGQEQYEEDVSACVFAVYSRIKQYTSGQANINPKYSFYHWLLFHVRTDLRDVRRKESRSLGNRQIVSLNELSDNLVVKEGRRGMEENGAEPSDTRMDVETAMNSLTARQRQVAVKYFLEHMTQVEIAEELGISQPAVQQLLRKAREKLVEVLE